MKYLRSISLPLSVFQRPFPEQMLIVTIHLKNERFGTICEVTKTALLTVIAKHLENKINNSKINNIHLYLKIIVDKFGIKL